MSFIISIGFCVVILIATIISWAIFGDDKDDDKINSSKNLHEEVNRERKAKGEPTVPQINTLGGISTNNIAARDKSWSSVPDFFIKLFKKNK